MSDVNRQERTPFYTFARIVLGVFFALIYPVRTHNREKLDQDDEDSIPIIDGYIAKTDYGVEFFAPCKGKNPLRELSTDDIQNFIQEIDEEVILLDVFCAAS